MATLCPSPFPLSSFSIPSHSKRRVPIAMDIVCYSFSHLSPFSSARRAAFGCSTLFRLITRQFSYSTDLNDNFGTAHLFLHTHPISSPFISQRPDVSGVACKGHCTVLWSLEADIEDGYVVYVTGDPVPLGCWDPNLAIPFSRSLDTFNLWEAQINVPWGINFKYNYIIRHSASAIEWRPGPEYSLSVPFSTGEDQVIRVRDCWMCESTRRFPLPSWGSWLADWGFRLSHPLQPALSLGEQKILENQNGSTRKHDRCIIQTNGHASIDRSISELQREKDGLVEEPWFIDSILPKLSSLLEEQTELKEEQADAIGPRSIREDVGSTVILINSSVCTMQRIAILEGGKLVELLLEPVQNEVQVKNKVQVDSIYLGVVTKLVPHMRGAFVDIGTKKFSLMGIFRHRKPFVYPVDEKEEEREDEDKEEDLEGVHEAESENTEDEYEEDVEVGGDDVADPMLEPLQGGNNKKVNKNQWVDIKEGTKIIVQVVKEELGWKGPNLTPYPKLRSRFWVLHTRSNTNGVSKKISGAERKRLKEIVKKIHKPPGFSLTVRTVAEGHSLEDLQKDLDGLLLTWKEITERAKSAALAADKGVTGAVPVMLHRAMGQTLSVVQDYFNEKVKSMVVDSRQTYDEVIMYLKNMAPELCERVELYNKKTPLFDEYGIEEDINGILSKRVALPNGGSLVIEQTEALVSIDVNAGSSVCEEGTSMERAALNVNLLAAKQVARELRLRDIGGIIVVNFIYMSDNSSKWKVYEEMNKAVKKDRSIVHVHEISDLGLMGISRQRVRPSVSFMISDPCICCQGDGRVEAPEISYMKIEYQIRRFLAASNGKRNSNSPKRWPNFELLVDEHMNYYLTSGNSTKLAMLRVSLNVDISIKLIGTFPRGKFALVQSLENKK